MTNEQSINIYVHILYAPNILGEMVLEQPVKLNLFDLAKLLAKKYKPVHFETLMDYSFFNEEFRRTSYGKNVSVQIIEADLLTAHNWSKNGRVSQEK